MGKVLNCLYGVSISFGRRLGRGGEEGEGESTGKEVGVYSRRNVYRKGSGVYRRCVQRRSEQESTEEYREGVECIGGAEYIGGVCIQSNPLLRLVSVWV